MDAIETVIINMVLAVLFFATLSMLTTFYVFGRKDQVNRRALADATQSNDDLLAILKREGPGLLAKKPQIELLLTKQRIALLEIPCIVNPFVQTMDDEEAKP